MSERPVYQSLMADGLLDRRHELALMRYAACREAVRKAGGRSSTDDPRFLIAQYAYFEGNILAHARILFDLLMKPYNKHWTIEVYAEEMLPEGYDIDTILDEVGAFLAVDHPAQLREHKRREEEQRQRWIDHPEERPAFLRRTRADA